MTSSSLRARRNGRTRAWWSMLGLLALLGVAPVAAAPEGFERFLAADAAVSWDAAPEAFRVKHGKTERVVWVGRLESMRYEVTEGDAAKVWLLFEWLPWVAPGAGALSATTFQVRAGTGEKFGAVMSLKGTEADMAAMRKALEATQHHAVVGGRFAGERDEAGQPVSYIFAEAIRLDDKLPLDIRR